VRGVPLQVIAEALGHSDTRITSKHYAHLMPSYVADTIRSNLPSFSINHKDNVIALVINMADWVFRFQHNDHKRFWKYVGRLIW
jgi:hypothetical protein